MRLHTEIKLLNAHEIFFWNGTCLSKWTQSWLEHTTESILSFEWPNPPIMAQLHYWYIQNSYKKLLLSTWFLTMALHAWNLTLKIRDHILKFKMYIMCGSLSQINHSNLKANNFQTRLACPNYWTVTSSQRF